MSGRSLDSDYRALEQIRERCADGQAQFDLMVEVFGEDRARDAVSAAFDSLMESCSFPVATAASKWADRLCRSA